MKISKVSYENNYTLSVLFEDEKVVKVDFEKFILNSKQPMTNQFKDINKFKKVKVENGHLSWLNGQMDISCHSIRKGNFNAKN